MSGTGPIATIQGELEKLDVTLHRGPLSPPRVLDSLRRIERIKEQLVQVEAQVRRSCSHEGASDERCPGCQEALAASLL